MSDDAPRKRPWFQIHLRTAIVLMVVAGVGFLSSCGFDRDRDILHAVQSGKIKREWSEVITHEEAELSDDTPPVIRSYKYGDRELEKAEKFLTGRFPRPWSHRKVLRWYTQSKNIEVKIALLRLLAVTGSAEAAWVHGQELEANYVHASEEWMLHLAAIDNINDYFVVDDGKPAILSAGKRHTWALKWWEKNKEKLRVKMGKKDKHFPSPLPSSEP